MITSINTHTYFMVRPSTDGPQAWLLETDSGLPARLCWPRPAEVPAEPIEGVCNYNGVTANLACRA